jgi:hypothetical protein
VDGYGADRVELGLPIIIEPAQYFEISPSVLVQDKSRDTALFFILRCPLGDKIKSVKLVESEPVVASCVVESNQSSARVGLKLESDNVPPKVNSILFRFQVETMNGHSHEIGVPCFFY